jgi:5,10-methylenetetrahydromethanopterin reductase
VDLVRQGAEKAGKSLDDVDRPELLVCCLSDDEPEAAVLEGKALVAYYLGTEPHIMKASKVDEDLIKRVQDYVGWPATEEDYRRAATLIPDDVVRNLMAVGTTRECQDKVAEYIDAGVTCPILYPMMDDIKPVIDAFSHWNP